MTKLFQCRCGVMLALPATEPEITCPGCERVHKHGRELSPPTTVGWSVRGDHEKVIALLTHLYRVRQPGETDIDVLLRALEKQEDGRATPDQGWTDEMTAEAQRLGLYDMEPWPEGKKFPRLRAKDE